MLKKSQMLTASLLLASSMSLMAVPAKPGLLPMTQPDGTTIDVRLYGDEFHHFYTTDDGYLLVEKDGAFYYGDVDASGLIVSSGIAAAPAARRSAAAKSYLAGVDMDRVRATMQLAADARTSKIARTTTFPAPAFVRQAKPDMAGAGLFPGSHFPNFGDQKGLVIIVEYKDVKMTLDNAQDYFRRMLNEPGFSDYGATGSAVDFFKEVSDSQFRPQFDVYGVVTLSQNRAYYGGNNYSGDDQRPGHMVLEACQQLDSQIDFSEYDRDGDGYVDNVFIFYAGRGEASGGSADTVWPHAWSMEAAVGYAPEFDGVKVSRYACSNEWEGTRPDGVGTFIHEFSHVMGLPDLYATSYTSSFTPGAWSCMDYGPYNNDGCTPPLYGAFERYALGWMEPMPIDAPVNATLPSIGSNKAGIVKHTDNEFFLFENRQQVSWDTYIPGHGMLVWHIDYNASVWDSNRVNNTPSHQYVDIEEADGTQSEYSRAGDAFPGTSNVTSFTDTGTPNMRTWGGVNMETPITDIAENGGIITFKAKGGRNEPFTGTTANPATDVDDLSFIASWAPVDDADYYISVFTLVPAGPSKTSDGSEGEEPEEPSQPARKYLYNLRHVGNATSYRVDGLEAETQYYYTVTVGNGWEFSEESEPVSVTTAVAPFIRRRITALEPSAADDNTLTAAWYKVDEAEGYEISVALRELSGHNFDVCNFDGGVDKIPAGWKTNCKSGYMNDAYSGQSQPALRMANDNDYIYSADYSDYACEIQFWVRGNGTADSDRLSIRAKVDGKWIEVKSLPVPTTQGGEIIVVDFEEEGITNATAARITFLRPASRGAVAIDDIAVGHGHIFADTPIPSLSSVKVGDTDSYKIEGLTPGTTYTYKVRALKGEEYTPWSNVIEATTTGTRPDDPSSALDTIVDTAASFTVDGLTVTADTPAVLYDLTGRALASGTSLTAPAPGIYLLAISGRTLKLALR